MTRTISKPWVAAPLAALILLAGASGAQAKGCLKGAAVGGVAGHFAHHHAVLGAAAGCVVGHHLAKKKEREERAQREERRREDQRRQAAATGH
jgi:outer membrane lipoprotein SlyB